MKLRPSIRIQDPTRRGRRASLAERFHGATKYTPERRAPRGLDFATQPSPFKDWYQARTLVVLPGDARGAGRPPEVGSTSNGSAACCFTRTASRASPSPPARAHHFRASPSAGGLYPAKALYVAVHGVAGAPDGIHDYLPREHALALCWEGDFRAELARYAFGHPAMTRARAVLILTAVFSGARGVTATVRTRRILLDSGHVMGNAVLAALPDGLAVAPVADFIDDGIDGLLLLDPAREATVLLAPVLEGVAPTPARAPRRSGVRLDAEAPEEGVWIRALHDASRLAADEAPEPDGSPWQPTACGAPVALETSPLTWGAAVHEAIRRRRSTRRFSGAPIPLRDVGRILAHALPAPGAPDAAPTVAPGLLDAWVVAGAVEGLAPGVYRHDAAHGALVPVRLGDPREALFQCCLQQGARPRLRVRGAARVRPAARRRTVRRARVPLRTPRGRSRGRTPRPGGAAPRPRVERHRRVLRRPAQLARRPAARARGGLHHDDRRSVRRAECVTFTESAGGTPR